MKELGTKPIGSLLRQYALPSIIAMTASSLYNMVDSIFIGHGVGPMALGGLAVTFPFMNLGAAFGAMIGVGTSTLISVKLGQKDYDTARRVLANNVTLNVIIGILFMTVSLVFLDKILICFGASDTTLGYARDYMKILLYGNIVTHLYLGLNAAARALGKPRMAMYATILTVVLNAILDPIFIFWFGWGIQGAAIATVLAQVVSLVWQLVVFSRPDEEIHIELRNLRLEKHIVRKALAIGMSPFMMNAAGCIIVIFINRGLLEYGGDYAVAAYGIVNRVMFVFFMVVMGFNQGMQPIAGYNFGAQKIDRLYEVLRKTIICAVVVMVVCLLFCELLPRVVSRIFTSDERLIRESVRGMRILAAMAPLIGFSAVVSNFFQSIGMAPQSIFLSLTRQMIFLNI